MESGSAGVIHLLDGVDRDDKEALLEVGHKVRQLAELMPEPLPDGLRACELPVGLRSWMHRRQERRR